MGFVRDLTGKTAVNAAKQSGELLTEAALEGSQLQSQGFLDANKAQINTSDRARAMFDPFADLGASGVEQAGFLTDPNQQFNFLQNNPLFQMGLDNANQQTMSNAASQGRLSSGDTLQQLTNNSLLAAQPLIQDQKNSIADLLRFGSNAATNQGNILLDQGRGTANSISNSANALADGITSAANARATGIIGTANARGEKAQNVMEIGTDIAKAFFGG
jgi:hypothetical protein